MTETINIKPIIPQFTTNFYDEYKNIVINEFKQNNTLFPIRGYFNINNLEILKFEDYSLKYDKLNLTNDYLQYINGILYHFSILEEFENIFKNNLDALNNKKKNDNIKKIEEFIIQNNVDKCYSFIIFSYIDLKHYCYKYKFVSFDSFISCNIDSILQYNNESDINKENIKNIIIDNVINKNINNNNTVNTSLFLNNYCYYTDNNIIVIDKYLKRNIISKIFKWSLYSYILNNNFNNKDEIKVFNKIKDTFSKKVIIIKSQDKNSIFDNLLTININNIKLINNKDSFNSYLFNYNNSSELNMLYKTVDLSSIFDTYSIYEESIELNLKLMKWRMAPKLNLSNIKDSKVLIIGAGTLGCNVSRSLIGWGIKHISFIDSGKISYSNPVRQCLYNFNDTVNNNNEFKSIVAARKLKEIVPHITSNGYVIHIPCPGMNIGNNDILIKSNIENINKIEELIKEHDVVYLLTDSRESRWLPSFFCNIYNKICITAAIGFNTFLVVRHNYYNDLNIDNSKKLNTFKNKIACYYCNDIVSPTDSTKHRTLDQQCTISRPGISSICSGYAVEILINLLSKNFEDNKELITPNCIRGNLDTWDILSLNNCSFEK